MYMLGHTAEIGRASQHCDVPLTPTHGTLYTGHTPEDGQLQSDDN